MNSMNGKIIVSLLLVITLVMCGCSSNNEEASNLLVLGDDYTSSVEENPEEVETSELEESWIEETENTDTTIVSVYICGAVNQSGVYELEEGSRIYHVIELAGGMTEDAMDTYLNLAEELIDGQKIYVPTVTEVGEGSENTLNWSVEVETETASGKVNINTASKEELMTLTGIGEAKAESIIEYRETYGAFENIEDIQNITGIKEGVYSQLEDEITVD